MVKKVVLPASRNPEKHAEEIRRTLESAMGDHFKRMAEFQEQADRLAKALAPSLKPIQDMVNQLNSSGVFQNVLKMREAYSGLLRPRLFETESVAFLPVPPRKLFTEEDVQEIVERAVEKSAKDLATAPSASCDLVYSSKEKILERTVPGISLSSRFKGGEAKRMNLFEKLLRAKNYVETQDLKEELGCPTTEAVRKLVQGINHKIAKELDLKASLIEGRSGFGYRLNPQISIHRR